jgi:hypothetical protein
MGATPARVAMFDTAVGAVDDPPFAPARMLEAHPDAVYTSLRVSVGKVADIVLHFERLQACAFGKEPTFAVA